MQIVLARKHRTTDAAGTAIGGPVAMMWLNDGAMADVYRARDYAAVNGYAVYVYKDNPDPLGAAKAMVNKERVPLTNPAP